MGPVAAARNTSSKEPRGQYSDAMQGGSRQKPRNIATFGWRSEAMMPTSCANTSLEAPATGVMGVCAGSGPDDCAAMACASSKTFSAMGLSRSFARKTCPNEPPPRRRSTVTSENWKRNDCMWAANCLLNSPVLAALPPDAARSAMYISMGSDGADGAGVTDAKKLWASGQVGPRSTS